MWSLKTSSFKLTGRVDVRKGQVCAGSDTRNSYFASYVVLIFLIYTANGGQYTVFVQLKCHKRTQFFPSCVFLFRSKATAVTLCGFLFIVYWLAMTKCTAEAPVVVDDQSMLAYSRVKVLSPPSSFSLTFSQRECFYCSAEGIFYNSNLHV